MDTAAEMENGSAIAELRSELERKSRFKTAFQGYEKSAVDEYLAQLKVSFEKALEEAEAESGRLKEENKALIARLEEQEDIAAETRSQERIKAESEASVREGIVANLRATNQRLVEENRRKQMDIADLEERLASMRAAMQESTALLGTLNASLEQMLAEKVKECTGIITAWKSEFDDAVTAVNEQIL